MNKLLINYGITSEIDLDGLNAILDGCRSKNNEVNVKFFVFSEENTVGKNIAEVNDADIATITVLQHSGEDPSNLAEMSKASIIEYASHLASCHVQENIVLKPYALDEMNFSLFKEDNECGGMYSDYDVVAAGGKGLRTFLCSPPIKKQMPIPCVFFSTERVMNFTGQDNPELQVFQQSMIAHIPKSLYIAYTK